MLLDHLSFLEILFYLFNLLYNKSLFIDIMDYQGRPIKAYLKVSNILPYVIYVIRSFKLFRNPFLFLISYFFYINIPYLKLRNGTIIYLSNHPHDCATIFAIFVRRDYGDMPKNSHVLDVGANIGIFAIYAIISGADYVYSLEPNTSSIDILRKNIASNGFEHKIKIINKAVASQSGIEFEIPLESSMYNKVLTKSDGRNKNIKYEKVSSISITDIFKKYPEINYSKIDCEGSEYDIILNTKSEVLANCLYYSIEFHNGNIIKLIEKFKSAGFSTDNNNYLDLTEDKVGLLNLSKDIV